MFRYLSIKVLETKQPLFFLCQKKRKTLVAVERKKKKISCKIENKNKTVTETEDTHVSQNNESHGSFRFLSSSGGPADETGGGRVAQRIAQSSICLNISSISNQSYRGEGNEIMM